MDALLALLTPGSNESKWTDQEVGVAVGRRVPVIPIRIGIDPYGLIGKYQAVREQGKKFLKSAMKSSLFCSKSLALEQGSLTRS